MTVVHHAHETLDQPEQHAALRLGHRGGWKAGVIQDHIVPPGFGEIAITGLRHLQDGSGALPGIEAVDERQPQILFRLQDLRAPVAA
jgi:hypothetical protein